MADAPIIPRPPSFVPDKGCSYCGTIRQQDGRCISCGAPRKAVQPVKMHPYNYDILVADNRAIGHASVQ